MTLDEFQQECSFIVNSSLRFSDKIVRLNELLYEHKSALTQQTHKESIQRCLSQLENLFSPSTNIR